jgi:hypothetical protein
MSRCIFRKTNRHQGWKLAPLIIIFAGAVITLEKYRIAKGSGRVIQIKKLGPNSQQKINLAGYSC